MGYGGGGGGRAVGCFGGEDDERVFGCHTIYTYPHKATDVDMEIDGLAIVRQRCLIFECYIVRIVLAVRRRAALYRYEGIPGEHLRRHVKLDVVGIGGVVPVGHGHTDDVLVEHEHECCGVGCQECHFACGVGAITVGIEPLLPHKAVGGRWRDGVFLPSVE